MVVAATAFLDTTGPDVDPTWRGPVVNATRGRDYAALALTAADDVHRIPDGLDNRDGCCAARRRSHHAGALLAAGTVDADDVVAVTAAAAAPGTW